MTSETHTPSAPTGAHVEVIQAQRDLLASALKEAVDALALIQKEAPKAGNINKFTTRQRVSRDITRWAAAAVRAGETALKAAKVT